MKKIVFYLILASLTAGTLHGANPWKRVIRKSGVSVYTRDVKGSDVDEFKGVAMIDADIRTVNR